MWWVLIAIAEHTLSYISVCQSHIVTDGMIWEKMFMKVKMDLKANLEINCSFFTSWIHYILLIFYPTQYFKSYFLLQLMWRKLNWLTCSSVNPVNFFIQNSCGIQYLPWIMKDELIHPKLNISLPWFPPNLSLMLCWLHQSIQAYPEFCSWSLVVSGGEGIRNLNLHDALFHMPTSSVISGNGLDCLKTQREGFVGCSLWIWPSKSYITRSHKIMQCQNPSGQV